MHRLHFASCSIGTLLKNANPVQLVRYIIATKHSGEDDKGAKMLEPQLHVSASVIGGLGEAFQKGSL